MLPSLSCSVAACCRPVTGSTQYCPKLGKAEASGGNSGFGRARVFFCFFVAAAASRRGVGFEAQMQMILLAAQLQCGFFRLRNMLEPRIMIVILIDMSLAQSDKRCLLWTGFRIAREAPRLAPAAETSRPDALTSPCATICPHASCSHWDRSVQSSRHGLGKRKAKATELLHKSCVMPEVRPCKLRSRVSLALSRGQGRAFGPLAQLSLFQRVHVPKN